MKSWLKYILIFGIIGAIIGSFLGIIIISYGNSQCPIGMECARNPYALVIPGSIIGLVVGALIGYIIGKIKNRGKK